MSGSLPDPRLSDEELDKIKDDIPRYMFYYGGIETVSALLAELGVLREERDRALAENEALRLAQDIGWNREIRGLRERVTVLTAENERLWRALRLWEVLDGKARKNRPKQPD